MVYFSRGLVGLVFLAAGLVSPAQGTPDVKDAFGRSVLERGITLLHWEGFMAGPMVKLTVTIPDGMKHTVVVAVTSDCPRIMFDKTPDDASTMGSWHWLKGDETTATLYVSLFPDHDGRNEEHNLFVDVTDADGGKLKTAQIPIHIVDQETSHRPSFPIHLDFTQDRTGYFKDPHVRSICEQAAADWAYFIDDMQLDLVKAGDEKIDLCGPDGPPSTVQVTNGEAYAGFWLYMVGMESPQMVSAGAPSLVGKPQTSHGKELPILRSGQVNLDIRGDTDRLGYFLSTGDEDWWCSGDVRGEPSDLYSVVHNQIGRALAFNAKYAATSAARTRGRWVDPDLHAYLGADPKYLQNDTFEGPVDPASGFGLFGSQENSTMKVRRRLITKAELLLLKSVGYKIRAVSCFAPLGAAYPLRGTALKVGVQADLQPSCTGGVPDCLWEVARGKLPPGMALDSFTGEISGKPTTAGSFAVLIRVTDQSTQAMHCDIPLMIHVD